MAGKKLSENVEELLAEIGEIVRGVQRDRYDKGLTPRLEYPLAFKELSVEKETVEKLFEVTEAFINSQLTKNIYRSHYGFLLLFSAFCMVRFEPFEGSFWDTFYKRLNIFSQSNSKLFEPMWGVFNDLSNKHWFDKPFVSWDKRRFLVHSIYREAKSLSFSQIKDFFVAYYSAYQDMRAFDAEYDQWTSHFFKSKTEKEENRLLAKDIFQKLFLIFNYLDEAELTFSEISESYLVSKIRTETGIDPETLFKDPSSLMNLILKIFQGVMTVTQFERYLSQKKPEQVMPSWLGGRKIKWEKLLAGGISYAHYRIGGSTFEIVPKTGFRLKNLFQWPFDRFIDPANIQIPTHDIESDIVALRRRNPFKVTIGDFFQPQRAVPLFDDRNNCSFIWLGTRKIGRSIETEGLTCPARSGASFLASLKYHPRSDSLIVFLSYVDLFDAEKRYAPLTVKVDDRVLWEGQTDSSGRRNSEIYEFLLVNPDQIPGRLEVSLSVDGEMVGSTLPVPVDEHMLFSRYSNLPISSGRTRFGESRFILLSTLLEDEIERSDSVLLNPEGRKFGRFFFYDIEWVFRNGPFRLSAGDVEWSFQDVQDVYFVSNIYYEDQVFELDSGYAERATSNPDSINFRITANLAQDEQKLFDYTFLRDSVVVEKGRFPALLELADSMPDGGYQLTHKHLEKMNGGARLSAGSYALEVQKGRPGSKGFFYQSFQFFVLPKLRLKGKESIYLEDDSIIAQIHADSPCFFEDSTNQWVNEKTVKLGTVKLSGDQEKFYRESLDQPSVYVNFPFPIRIFGYRIESLDIGSVVNLETLKKHTVQVFGPPGETLNIVSNARSDELLFSETGIQALDYEGVKKHLCSQQTGLRLQCSGKEILLTVVWSPEIRSFVYPDKRSQVGKIIAKEAAYEITIEGPHDGKVVLKLMNNLGQVCGQTCIEGNGSSKGSVNWSETVTLTNAATLKAFFQDSTGNLIAMKGGELLFDAVTPDRELQIVLRRAKEEPTTPEYWVTAAQIAHDHSLREPDEIIQWVSRSLDLGLSDAGSLEKVAGIYRSLGKETEAAGINENIIRLHGASINACKEYLDNRITNQTWGIHTDDSFRAILYKARQMGLSSKEGALYDALRALKKDKPYDALNDLYALKNLHTAKDLLLDFLISLCHFKNGTFYKIGSAEDSKFNVFYEWASWVTTLHLPARATSVPSEGAIIWNLLNNHEINVLKTLNLFGRKDPIELISAIDKYPECLPGIVTKWALFRALRDLEGKRQMYYKLVSSNTEFESEIDENGTL